jgi:hypothetical protein
VDDSHPASTRSANRPCVAIAWTAVLLASTLLAVIWGKVDPAGAGDTRWLPASIGVQVGGLFLLVLATLLWPTARPMRLPLVMLLAFLVGWRVLTPLVAQRAEWAGWQAGQPVGVSLATSRLQWLPPAALMTLVAVGAGVGRARLFLARGDWTAPVAPELLFPLKRWRWFPGMFVLVLLLGTVPLVVGEFVLGLPGWVTALGPDFGKADRLLTHFPGIVAGSVLNAAFEEYIFRATLLACFIPAAGVRHALGLTAVLFGLEHWPTAGFGVVHTCYYGWLCGKSMTETRGWSWAVVQHTFGDIPIYALVAMSRP